MKAGEYWFNTKKQDKILELLHPNKNVKDMWAIKVYPLEESTVEYFEAQQYAAIIYEYYERISEEEAMRMINESR